MKIDYELKNTRGEFGPISADASVSEEMKNDDVKELVNQYISEFISDSEPTETTYFRVERLESVGCEDCDESGFVTEWDDEDEEEYCCGTCDGQGTSEVPKNKKEWSSRVAKAMGDSKYEGIAHYSDVGEDGKWFTEIFAVYDCGCPCSDVTLAKLTWK